jgi:hypothetical protein
MLNSKINRQPPLMGVEKYVTWSVSAPRNGDFWVAATCEEVECGGWSTGWVSRIDETTELGQAQAAYIRADRSRRHTERRTPEGLTEFVFPPGQPCFQSDRHRARTGRPDLYVVRGGDWRGTTTAPRVYEAAEHWVNDFAEHQDRLSRAQQ